MNIYAKQKQGSQIQKTNLWLPKGRGKEKGKVRRMGLTNSYIQKGMANHFRTLALTPHEQDENTKRKDTEK